MRKALRWLLALTVLIGTLSTAGAATAAPPEAHGTTTGTTDRADEDIKDRLLAIPGMSLVEEKPYTGYRFFVLNYTQPVDHRHPSRGTFQQRITVLHKDTERPTVFYTGGYNVSTTPSRREPTQIVDGNQVSWSTATSRRPGPRRPTGPSSTSGRRPVTSTASSGPSSRSTTRSGSPPAARRAA